MLRLFNAGRVLAPRAWSIRAVAVLATASFAGILSGCGARELPQEVLAPRCLSINGATPLELRVVTSSAGPVRFFIEQRGVSVVSTLRSAEGGKQGWMLSASSPTERYGVMTFAPDLHAGEAVAIAIRSHDSPDITGQVCVAADRLPPEESRLLRAEREFANAGKAVQTEQWQHAFELYLAAARDFNGLDDRRLAQSRHALAEVAYSNLRDDEGAYVLSSWALADFGPTAEPGLRSALVTLQARALLESQRFAPEVRRARVYALLRRSEAFAREAKFGARELPRFDILRGFMEFRIGHASQATELFGRAARACEALRDWECVARARQNIAAMAEEARDYAVALQSYREALDALPPNLEPKLSADIWGNYGRLQGIAGLFRQAEVSHRTSIRVHAELADCDGTRVSISHLGTLLVQVGSIGEGHAYLTRAASLDCPRLIAGAKRESADNDAPADLTPGAAPAADCIDLPAPETLSEAGKLAVFNALLGLRDASRLENDEVSAQRCLSASHAYAATARTKLRFENAAGATLLERGKPEQATAAFQRALTIADGAQLSPTHENRTLAYIGLARAALLDNRLSDARTYAARALVLGGARAALGQVVESLQLIARSYSAQQATEPAVDILQVAANIIEQVPIDDLDAEQRATWLATQHAVFSELTTLFAARAGNDEARSWEAFEVSERGRARSLRYALSQATDTRATSSSEPASARYRELMRHISELARSAQASKATGIPLESLQKVVLHSAAVPDASMSAALRQRLRALDATVVEYAAGRETMFVFVIDGEHIRVVPLGARREIATAAAALYERVRNPESAQSDVRDAARRVAELALWPVADFVRHRRVIFIPDDALHTVPFALLPWTSGTAGPLVVERTELSIMPSTVFITRAGAPHAAFESAPRLELIGDPVFRAADWQRECRETQAIGAFGEVDVERVVTRSMNGSLPRLPGSRAEIAAIAELAHRYSPGSRVREHLGCEATPRALREAAATNPTLLHIATHGYVDAYRPRLSALALTPDEDSKGVTATFGLLDILRMKIDSRLVVLSACDTSRGRLLPGEGVLGPAQAFLQAGAASVLASYWRIADDATAPFMRTFYRHLLVERMTAAAALRQTQLDYLRAGSSHVWAAFTLFGWPDTSL
jgi:CHAT domain-containing protein/tetratricopeptide (TPR) repeat protein